MFNSRYYIIYLFLLSCILFAQEIKYEVQPEFKGYRIRLSFPEENYIDNNLGSIVERKYVDFHEEYGSGKFVLPSKTITIAIPPNTEPEIVIKSFKTDELENHIPAVNKVASLLNDSTISYSKNKSIGKLENFKVVSSIQYFWLRDYYCAAIRLNTHHFDGSKILRITDLDLELRLNRVVKKYSPMIVESDFDKLLSKQILNSSTSNQFKSKRELLKNNNSFWINFDADYVKIGISDDGIFRIYKAELEEIGYQFNTIDPKTFRMFYKGEEIPIYFFGESDNEFNDNDYIEFIGTKNYNEISPRILNSDSEPYNNYLNRYTDTSYYFLTWGNENGRRIPTSSISESTLDTLTNHYNFIHLEENPRDALYYTFHPSIVQSQLPFWDTGKGWYWDWLANWRPQLKIDFDIENIAEEGLARFYSKIMSYGSDVSIETHKYIMELGNNILDTAIADRFERTLLVGQLSVEGLNNGKNTLYLKYSNNNGSTTGSSVLDWVEVEYPQKMKFESDELYLSFMYDINPGIKTLKIENAESDSVYLIYKMTPQLQKIENYEVKEGYLLFNDYISNGDKYIITTNNIRNQVELSKKKFSNLQSTLNSVDYVAITHKSLFASASEYVKIIAKNYEYNTEIVKVSDIYDEFGFGFPTAESIKNYIELKIRNSPSPGPSYFVLIGDANYDYKGYRKKYDGVKGGGNIVPSYGFPVSDSWFTIFEDSILPEVFIGRIPVNSNDELQNYSQKVENYINLFYSDWNKRAIFFSGGDGNNISELNTLKNTNDRVINEIVSVPPLNSLVTHFYKSEDGDFGPFPDSKIKQVINDGGLFISYIGHSGTSTWDNSIVDVSQLRSENGNATLITDFGCSTSKFAEPDIISFGERFLLDEEGEAISYIGNSSLGFISIATSAPKYFYESLVHDIDKSIGAIHHKSKLSMFNNIGTSSVFKVYNYSNTLIGDPAIRIKVPEKPNFKMQSQSIKVENEDNISSELDSIKISILVPNEGLVFNDDIVVKLQHSFKEKILMDTLFTIPMPAVEDTLYFDLALNEYSGVHKILVNVDFDNKISEFNEDDNSIEYEFYVFTNKMKDLVLHDIENPKLNKIKILSPYKSKSNSTLIFEQADNEELIKSSIRELEIDSVFTEVDFINENWGRTWFRYAVDGIDTVWSSIKSFSNTIGNGYLLNDSISYANQKTEFLQLDSTLTISNKKISFGVVSAGSFAGANCIITQNGKNLLSTTFFPGIGLAVIDNIEFSVDTVISFDLWNKPQNVRALTSYLYEIEKDKIVIMGVSFDAVNNMTDSLKNAIKLFGSTLIDSLEYKGSWCLIGGKNLQSNEILEEIKRPYDGPASLTKDYDLFNTVGFLETEKIGPVKKWNWLESQIENYNNSSINIFPIGTTIKGLKDTLDQLTLVDGFANLDTINNKYQYLSFIINLNTGDHGVSPKIHSFLVNYTKLSELAINYQVVSVEKDTVQQGEDANLQFYVYNVGESTADSFKVTIDVVKPDNSKEKIFEEVVDSIGSEKRKKFNIAYPTTNFNGPRTFSISIDTEEKVDELYEDNNFYNIPFYVVGDTTKPTMNLTFDGNDIFDGEYISSQPKIKIELSDPSLVPITDTSSISIFLNNKYVNYLGNENNVSVSFSQTNPKVTVNYTPSLEDGEYTLRVFGKDASGNVGDSSGISKSFNVQSEAKLLNVYNYPNPFNNDTYFTFKLTQIPDEIKIKVFTIAGRLIEEIDLSGSQLNYDLNKIYWDGRDQDGDLIGNGVYLYKVIMDVDGKKQDVTQKLAVVR